MLPIILLLLLTWLSLGATDYYKILDVPRDADDNTLKKAFRRQSLKYHPDRNKEPDAQDQFVKVNEAYNTLKDPEKRQIYDKFGEEGLKGHGQQQQQQQHPGGDPFRHFTGGGGQQFTFNMGGQGGGFQGFPGGFPGFGGFGGFGGFQQQQQQHESLFTDVNGIEELTPKIFRQFTESKDKNQFVQFYSAKSPPDVDLYTRLAESLKGYIEFGAVNCDAYRELCASNGVSAMPAFVFYDNDNPKPYTGSMTSRALYDWLVDKMTSRVAVATTDNYAKLVKTPAVILFSKKPQVSPMYKSLSAEFTTVNFFQINSQETICKDFMVFDFPALLFIDKEGRSHRFTGEMNHRTIQAFISRMRIPMAKVERKSTPVIRLDSSCTMKNCPSLSDSANLLLLTPDVETYLPVAQTLSNEFAGGSMKLGVAIGNSAEWMKAFGLDEKKSHLVMYRPKAGKYAVETLTGGVDYETAAAFLDKVTGGGVVYKKLG